MAKSHQNTFEIIQEIVYRRRKGRSFRKKESFLIIQLALWGDYVKLILPAPFMFPEIFCPMGSGSIPSEIS